IGGLMSTISPAAPFFFAAILAAGNLLLLWSKFPETHTNRYQCSRRRSSAWGEALAHGRLRRVILSYFLLITGFSIMTGMFALFTAQKLGLDATQNGLVFAFIGVIAAAIQGRLIGGWVRRFGDLPLARLGAILVGLGLLGLPFVGGMFSLLSISALLAAGNSLMMPTLAAIASRQADAQSQGRTLGVLQSGASLARFLGPLAGGALFHWGAATGSNGIPAFWTGALLVFGAGWLAPKSDEPILSQSGEEQPGQPMA
ncbi:MAG: MFS transporter, partial [Verrucomicrobiia bacterium]